jgi:hypothetical protein
MHFDDERKHRFTLEVKQGLQTLAKIDGVEVPSTSINLDDLRKVIETEQFLEKIFHYRFHISTVEINTRRKDPLTP